MKHCRKCDLDKPDDAFYAYRKHLCKVCENAQSRAWNKNNREKAKANSALSRQRPHCKKASRARHAMWRSKNAAHLKTYRTNRKEQNYKDYVRWRYGLTSEQYEALVATKGRRCWICGAGRTKHGKGHRRICIDHDHESNVVRGLLCGTCNLGIGYLKTRALLTNAIRYLDSNANMRGNASPRRPSAVHPKPLDHNQQNGGRTPDGERASAQGS